MDRTDEFRKNGLLDGEIILWEGKSRPFRILSGSYAGRIPLIWIVSGLFLAIFGALYLPFAFRTQSGPMQVIFACATVGIVPVSCCVYSIKDPWDIRKNISYVLTNYRALTIHRRGEYSLWLNPDTPLRTEQWEDGTGILYLGDACQISPLESRQKTVMGIREDESDQRKVTGLVFYGIDDPKKVGQKICSSGTCGEKSNIL